ncbi:hypothetical protein PVAND_004642 [Polypedilum vanderplanki]|uniref:UDP-xylose and UDP-N-acetylglucosamine transporter n=1 Tax=Polypedilum vanderplanki TaxID=319348 RepID=A0A9J6BY64_POLVA|nr:hypothetical protein PVAND_004642 [Polypedilum vanderplanki]
MNYRAFFSVFGVFVGCCLDALYLEFAVKYDPGSGNLITFLQFLSIALVGLIFTSKFFTVKNNIPMKDYVLLVVMFFVSSVLNNYALNFNISVPLLMIFRSGSLMANMVLGIIILNKSYDMWKYLSVILITIGIFICTIASGSDIKKSQNENESSSFFWWLFGVFLLSLALFISARMGLYQEVMYKKRGKHANEALFYTHLLPLPIFLLMGKNIYNHFEIALQSKLTEIPIIGISIHSQIAFLILNFVSHYICVSSVYTLTSECTSLTVTMVITLRKFASLLFSIIYFRHPFTFTHWLGTILIIIGTVMFTEIVTKIRTSMNQNDSSESFKNDSSSNGLDIERISDEQNKDLSFYRKMLKRSTQKIKSITIPRPHISYKILENTQ